MAHERPLRVVEVAALRLDRLAGLAGVLFLPLGDDVEVALNFEKAFENEWEALRGWLLEGENLHVVVVEAQMPPMTFEVGFAEVVVEKRIMLEPGELEFLRREIDCPLQDSECFLLGKQIDSNEVTNLQHEALHLLVERGERFGEFRIEQIDLFTRGQDGLEFCERFLRIRGKCSDGFQKDLLLKKALEEHHVKHLE